MARLLIALVLSAASPVVAQTERVKVLVLDPTSSTVDASVLQTVGSLVSVELARSAELDVITSTDVKKIAALEAEKQGMGCEDSSCLAELAGAMGAKLVVFGDANKLGSLTVLNLSLFDSAKAQSVGRVSVQAATIEELPQKLPGAVRELVRDALTQQGIKVEAPSAAPAPVAAAAEPSSSPLASVWMFGLIGVGALVGVGGVGYDLVSPTSGDGALNGFDAIGPGLVVVGLAAVGVGIFVNPFSGASDG